jgi:hypothetical protein
MYAKIAADLAADETDSGHRAQLLDMAQAWQKLANEDAPRVAQQQQQPQPNDSGGKSEN